MTVSLPLERRSVHSKLSSTGRILYRAWHSRQPIFKLDNEVSHKPFSQRVIGLGLKKP
jgi:hypothetical protein